MSVAQESRLYAVRQDGNGNPQINANGKYITYKAPKGWDSTFTPNNLLELGFTIVLLDSLNDLDPACLVPIPTTGAPTLKQFTLQPYTPNNNYSWSFTLDDIATAYVGTTLKNVSLQSSAPQWLGITSATGTNNVKTYTIAGKVPDGFSGTLTIPVIVTGSNNLSTGGSFSATQRVVSPIYGYVSIFGNDTTVRIGPNKLNTTDVNPWITLFGQDYVSTGRVQMDPFQSPVIPTLDNKKTEFQKTYTGLPRGNRSFVAKIEHLGQTLYAPWVSVDGNLDSILTFQDTNPYSDGTIQAGTWSAYNSVNLVAGQQWSMVLPGTNYSGSSGVKTLEIVGAAPEGFVLTKSSGIYSVSYNTPNNDTGTKTVNLKLTENSGNVLTNSIAFIIEAANMTAMLWGVSTKDYWAGLAPVKKDSSPLPRVRVVRSPGNLINQAWQNMDPYEFNANNQLFPYRKTGFDFSASGENVVAFEKDNLVRYAIFNSPFSGIFPLNLSATEPTQADNVIYFVNVPGGGINEGSTDYLRAFRRVNGVDTPHSGGKFKTTSLGAGVTINEDTGLVYVATNTTIGDNYTQSFYYEVSGVNVFNGSFQVNDTTTGTNPIDNTDYSDKSITGFYDSAHGQITALSVTAPASLDEGTGSNVVAISTAEDGYQETDETKMNLYLASATGDFILTTNDVLATIGGVKLGRNGLITVDTNTTLGDNRTVRVKVEYGGQEQIKSINIIDKSTSQAANYSQVWLRYNSTTNGIHNFSAVVVGSGSFEYQTLSNDGYGWTGTFLTSASAPTTGTTGTSISRDDSKYSIPRQVQIRIVNQPATLQTVNIPTQAGIWTKVYQA